MSDERSFAPTAAPRPVALTTTAVVAVAVLALGLAGYPAALLAAGGGALLARALDALGEDDARSAVRGVAGLAASLFLGTLALVATVGAPDVAARLGLVGALWLAAFCGVGVGRGVLNRTSLGRAWQFGVAGFVGIGLAFPVAGLAVVFVGIAGWLLALNATRPSVGTLLALCAAACGAVGLALERTAGETERRRPINRQLRERATQLRRLGIWLLVGWAAAGTVGALLGGYALLGSLAPPLWRALALATGTPFVRAVPLAVIALAGLGWLARGAVAWALDEGEVDARRAGFLTSALAAPFLFGATTVAVLAVPALPVVGGAVSHDVTVPGAWGMLAVAVLATSAALFLLRASLGTSGTIERPPGVRACAGALLVGAAVVALAGSAVVAPLVGVAAATIVWDVGRVGGRMGVELGDRADVDRGALVRVGGSAAVGALATVVGVALALAARWIGGRIRGPVVLVAAVGVALVLALAWYARKRAASPG